MNSLYFLCILQFCIINLFSDLIMNEVTTFSDDGNEDDDDVEWKE